MIIISHRGYWHEVPEKNTEAAFRRSFQMGFGTETDIRDSMGSLVISHDMPFGTEMLFSHLLSIMGDDERLLALNVKSDGLAKIISKTMKKFNRNNWFVFDMSIPDMRDHLSEGNPVFTRMSEVEQVPAWLDRVEGIWLDSFESQWFDMSLVSSLLYQGKRVCVVSSELHGRDQRKLWADLLPIATEDQLILCTDFPAKAVDFFELSSKK